jgi:hypothetical protein
MFKSYANGATAAFAIVLLFVIVSVKIDWVYYVVVLILYLKVLGINAATSHIKLTLMLGCYFAKLRLTRDQTNPYRALALNKQLSVIKVLAVFA